MKCPKCNTENPVNHKFCGECATPLESDVVHTKTLETPTEELKRGSVFAGRYEVIEELGKGGMGRVYRVEDTKIRKEIALKLIKPEIASDKKTIERFKNELTTAREIAHRNVCRMFDLGEDKGQHYITMEYVPGGDLKRLIRRTKRLDIGTAISIAKQICDGLEEAHSLGIVHRDLKPNNIMIDDNGNARIMDFGIARTVRGKGITGAGVMIGTPEYMSPEQAEAKEIDHRSDIYSLGVILYEMTTGLLPFEGETSLAVAMKHKSETPKDPKEFNPQITEDLSRAIIKCLEKNTEDRYQKAAEVKSEIEKIEQGLPTTDRVVPSKKTLTSNEITVQFRLKKIIIPVFAVITIAIIGLIIWSPWSNKTSTPIPSDKPSLAVLPFDDESPKKDQGDLCDGIPEQIILALSKVENLDIPAPTSSFSLRGKDIIEVGEKLKVNTVLKGSLRKVGNRVRITPQLVNIDDGLLIWGDIYESEQDDIFDIQDEITLKILEKLKVELLQEEREAITKRYTDNAKAYNLYLQGLFFWNKRTEESNRKAITFFKEAIEIDPDYALAYAGLSDSYGVAAGYHILPSEEAYSMARNAATKALNLDDTLSEAHTSLAGLKRAMDWDWKGSEESFLRAIELNSNNANAHHWYSFVLSHLGRHEEAIKEAKRAQELDPLSHTMSRGLGGVYLNARQYKQAIEELERAIEFGSKSYFGHLWLFSAYHHSKLYKESIGMLMEFADLMEFSEKKVLIEKINLESGYNAALQQVIPIMPGSYGVASFYALLGDKDKAFKWLEKAYSEYDYGLGGLKVDPNFDSFHSDSRFKAFLKKIKLD